MPPSIGRYRVDRLLGSGAFASVWLGFDEALDAAVAIKVLSGSLIDDLDVRTRFLEEARILRRADSERLVSVHDMGELPDERPFFVMSYADRGTLADRLTDEPLPLDEALRIAEETALGVSVVNALGIIHRDLKPSNVLFQSTHGDGERVVIADLGLAKALAHASGVFTLPVGTPGYMSPEQAQFGGGLDIRADVYGLGALTYHLVTGKPPGTPPIRRPPSELRLEIPAAVDAVIMRALEVDRERRWPDADSFAAALAELRTPDRPADGSAGTQPAGSAGGVAPATPTPPGTKRVWPSARPAADRNEDVETTVDISGADAAGAGASFADAPGDDRDTVERQRDGHGRFGTDRPDREDDGRQPGETEQLPRPQAPAPGSGYRQGSPGATPESRSPAASQATRWDVVRPPATPPGSGPTTPPTAQGPYPGPGTPPPPTGPPGPAGPSTPPTPGGMPVSSPGTRAMPAGDAAAQRPGGGVPAGGGRSWRSRLTGRTLIVIGAAVAAVLVGVAALVVVFSGEDKRAPADNWITVRDSTGRLTLRVPPTWKKQPAEGWSPAEVQLTDQGTAPALRATPELAKFREVGQPVPGVFVGLSSDVAPGKLPPPGLQRPGCTPQPKKPQQAAGLNGNVVALSCPNGITYQEVGLYDPGKRFAVWVEIKQAGGPDLAAKILGSLRVRPQ